MDSEDFGITVDPTVEIVKSAQNSLGIFFSISFLFFFSLFKMLLKHLKMLNLGKLT